MTFVRGATAGFRLREPQCVLRVTTETCISTGLARSQSWSRNATLNPSRKATQFEQESNTSVCAGGVEEAEMFRTFNMGIGMAVVVSADDARAAQRVLPHALVIGKIGSGEGVEYRNEP